jgi:hypothetical protein
MAFTSLGFGEDEGEVGSNANTLSGHGLSKRA